MIRTAESALQRLKSGPWQDPIGFASMSGVTLRPYQEEIAHAIIDSVSNNKGLTFVVVLPRQSGKNELQSHILSWLLFRYARKGARMVSVSPTFKPQVINAMDRVRASLDHNPGTMGRWKGSSGFIFKYHASRLQFFSADPSSKVVGATADILLSVDEAQDVQPDKYHKDFDPMTASTNATRVFWGTVWTSRTLLAQQMQTAKEDQEKDGVKRLFFYTADDIRKIVPAYGEHVDRVVKEKGREHPLVKTQYFCEQIDAEAGMFSPARLALMKADQPAHDDPQPGVSYAFCIDVAGADESATADMSEKINSNPGRDSTTLTIYSIDLSQIQELQAPTFRIVHRQAWTGLNHVVAWGKLKAYNDIWNPQYIIIDSTGVGEGLTSMFARCCASKTMPVKFSAQKKSEIGYRYLAMIETGRIRDCARTPEVDEQYRACISEVLIGPQKTMRWSVPEGTRNQNGQLIHDDYILADALIAEADMLEWYAPSPTLITAGRDPLAEMDRI